MGIGLARDGVINGVKGMGMGMGMEMGIKDVVMWLVVRDGAMCVHNVSHNVGVIGKHHVRTSL